MNRTILSLLGIGLAANALVFQIYRILFLTHFERGSTFAETVQVLWNGLRLDLALLGFEFFLIGLCLLALRRVRPQRLLLGFWALTGLHAFLCVINFSTIAERSQNAGELLLPYITSPYQVYLAVMPFCQEHWPLMLALAAVVGFYFWLGFRFSRKVGAQPVEWWRNRRTFAVAFAVMILPLLLTLQPVLGKKATAKASRRGWTVKVSDSKYFARFSQPMRNQAVLNPLFEFLSVQAPARLRGSGGYHLTEAEALEVWREATGHAPADPRYPLLTTIHGNPQSRIENVIIIQVEGLSRSLLDQERDGRVVTPFLRQMAREGIYFSNAFQNANFTSGGVFSTLASVPKITFEQATSRFASFEMEGRYGSLARVLGGTNYTHFFCEGFRQSWDDFMAFTSRQGCEARGYSDFRNVLERKARLAGADSLLGISDGAFLQEFAEMFLNCSNRFTAHCMTCTTHSPWAVPAEFPMAFDNTILNTFAYFDASLRAFCERLQGAPAVWDKTMVVVLGDHTSVTFGSGYLERLRIPLIFYGPQVAGLGKPDPRPASQVDVVPTILAMMPGEHPYAGMGRNLLDPTWSDTGIIGGTTEKGFFLKGGYLLEYSPATRDIRLHAVTNDTLGGEELSARRPDLTQRMRREYFAQIELARRLALSRQIFPLPGTPPGRVTTAAAPR